MGKYILIEKSKKNKNCIFSILGRIRSRIRTKSSDDDIPGDRAATADEGLPGPNPPDQHIHTEN